MALWQVDYFELRTVKGELLENDRKAAREENTRYKCVNSRKAAWLVGPGLDSPGLSPPSASLPLLPRGKDWGRVLASERAAPRTPVHCRAHLCSGADTS